MNTGCEAGGSSCRREIERCSYPVLYYKGEVDSGGRRRADCCAPNFCDRTYTPNVYTLCSLTDGRDGTCYGVCRK